MYITKSIISNKLKKNKEDKNAILAMSLEHNKVQSDSPIGGLKFRLQFNHDKLTNFINTPRQEWYKESHMDLNYLLPKPKPKKEAINLLLKSFSFETHNANFENYKQDTEQQKKMWNYMSKFVLKVITKTFEYGPIGIILSGTPGIGKTHLSVAIAKYASAYGKKVTFVDDTYIKSTLTSMDIPDFRPLISDSDLIILDDINSEFGIFAEFLKQVLEFVILNNKALLYTSNNVIPIIQSYLPIFFGYDHPFVKNFLAINNIVNDSFRKPWTTEDLKSLSDIEKYKLLNSYSGGQSAGIIINTSEIDENKYIEEFRRETKSIEPIRIVRDWDSEQSLLAFKTYDKIKKLEPIHRQQYKGNVTDLEKYKIIIIRIYNSSSVTQLLENLPRLHDNGIKVIVLTKSTENFKKLINDYLKRKKEIEQKITDRLRIILPEINFFE